MKDFISKKQPLYAPVWLMLILFTAGPVAANETGARHTALAARLPELKHLSKEQIQSTASSNIAAYLLKDNKRILVLDFPTTYTQARMLGRIVLFIERHGTSRTRVMSVPDVQKWLAQHALKLENLTVGNNIRASELARFFNTARFQGEPLTIDETHLYHWLLDMQVLKQEASGIAFVEPEVIVISVPQAVTENECAGCAISAAQRQVILEHELAHARYTLDLPYQHYAKWFWSNQMDMVVRSKFMHFLRNRGYDTSNHELMANEMQAFLMHTADTGMFSASAVGMTETELKKLRLAFDSGLSSKPAVVAERLYQFE